MKLTKMGYSRVFSLGNYENEKISVECEIDEAENTTEVYTELKQVVENAHNLRNDLRKYAEAQTIVKNPDMYKIGQVKEAKAFITDFETKYPSLSDVKLHALLNSNPIAEDIEQY